MVFESECLSDDFVTSERNEYDNGTGYERHAKYWV
jgi:hypothetical protein